MRYDDADRPHSDVSALKTALQISGSPLPAITLMRPMEMECTTQYKGSDGLTYERTGTEWGWLCCIHAHRGTNRFGTHYGQIRDLGEFQRAYLEDPEAALRRWFKYEGPELVVTEHSPKSSSQVIEEDLFS